MPRNSTNHLGYPPDYGFRGGSWALLSVLGLRCRSWMLVGVVHGLWEFVRACSALGVVARLELMLGCCCGSNNHDCRHCLLRRHGFDSFSSRTFMRYVLIGVGLFLGFSWAFAEVCSFFRLRM